MAEPAPEGPFSGVVGGLGLLAGLLGGGIGVGVAIAVTAGGGTEGAIFIGIFTLPIALGAGISAWRAVLGAWLIGGLGRSALRSRGDEVRFREETRRSIAAIREAGVAALPGTWVFIPAAIAIGLIAAFLMWFAATDSGLLAGVLLLVATAAYGVLLRRLARSGRLLFPE